jgi:hypothetical protein
MFLLQTVEWFLVKEVNYVVTDRPHWTGVSTAASGGSVSGSTPKCGAIPSSSLTPLGGQCSCESPATLDSPGDGLRGGGKRSVSCLLTVGSQRVQSATGVPV